MAAERRLRSGLSWLLLPLLLLPAGCAHGLAGRSTRDLYQDLLDIRLVAFHCSGSTLFYEPGGAALEQRVEALRPWLETALDSGELARMDANAANQMGLLDAISCSSPAERGRSLAAYRRRVEELERRSRLQP